jgi:hypothetical protein
MLGSSSTYFLQSVPALKRGRENVALLLKIKGYSCNQVAIYLKAFDFFTDNPSNFDGATIVKDLVDLPGLDLDAMHHDYCYVVYGVGSSLVIKTMCDWLFAKGMERKGKGLQSAYGRFILLTVISVVFVPYTSISKGRMSYNKRSEFIQEYRILIKKAW